MREYMARIAYEDKWMLVSERKVKEWCRKKEYSYPTMKKVLLESGLLRSAGQNKREAHGAQCIAKKSTRQ